MPNWKKVIVSGSDAALNSLIVTNGVTGSLLGTASYADYATSASYALTASYAPTASYATNASDIILLVKNQSGQNIAKGVVVRITGSNTSSDIPRIVTASYENDNNSANTLGITNQSIANGDDGYVMTEGILLGIDTNAFVSGQLIYLGPTGSIIGTAPQAPLHAVRLGEVIRHQSNNGSIYVRIDNGYELGELHDVRDTTTTSSYGDLLVKSGSIWINSKQLTGSYGLTGSLTATSFTGSLLGTASYAIQALTASYTPSIAGTDNYIPKFNGSSALENSVMYDDGTNIGIGTTSPSAKLHVVGGGNVATIGSAGSGQDNYIKFQGSSNAFDVGTTTAGYWGIADAGVAYRFVVTQAGNVGIGTTTPAYKLSVVGKMALNDGGNSIFIGDNAGLSDDATDNRNVAIGTNASQNNTTGARNTAVGYNSLNTNLASDNTGFGYFTLSNVTTGTSNTAVGSASQVSASIGNFNTSVGTNTLFSNASGSNNTAVGSSALRNNITGSNNSGFGISALFSNTSGSSNTAIGAGALQSNVTGSENTALGRNAGRYFGTGTSTNTNASASIFIGFNSRANNIGETNQIVIGNEALGLGNDTVVLGNDNIVTTALKGNVGIGLTNPSYKLDISGQVAQILSNNSSFTAWYIGNTSTGNAQTYYDAINGDFSGADYGFVGQHNSGYMEYYVGPLSPNPSHVFSSGNVGIGTTSPGQKLHVAGNISASIFYPAGAGGNYIAGDGAGLVAGGPSYFYSNGSGGSYFEGNVRIRGGLSNDTAAYMQINGGTSGYTYINGSLGIGTSSPSTTLALAGATATTFGLSLTPNGWNGAKHRFTVPTSGDTSMWSFNWNGSTTDYSYATSAITLGQGLITFATTGSANSPAERMRINGNGSIQFNSYGSGTFTGTATQKLAVDSSGNIIEIPIGAGPVDGSGTANYITRWVDTDTITTSSIYETGGNIGIGTTSPNNPLHIFTSNVSGSFEVSGFQSAGSPLTFLESNYGGGNAVKIKFLNYNPSNGFDSDFGIQLMNTSQTMNDVFIIKGSTGNVGIGTTSPAYKLSVVGKIALNDGGNSVFIGTNAGLSDDATDNRNIAIGTNSLQNNISGSQNVAIGYNSLVANTSVNNTAVGSNALQFSTTSVNNTAFGSFALNANTVGSSSIAVGAAALLSNTTGNHNTALGNSAIRSNVSGSQNVGVGGSVLFNNTNGSDNVALGWNAARYFGTGTSSLTDTSGSIFIGSLARANASGEVNQVVIGMNALGLGSNSVVLGNDNITKTVLKGNVGIGTNVPMGPLEIYKANAAGLGGHLILNNDGSSVGNSTAILFNDSGGGSLSSVRAAISSTTENSPYYGNIQFKTGATTYGSLSTRMTIQGDGAVGINTTSPSYKLDVNGTGRFANSLYLSAGNVDGTGGLGIGDVKILSVSTSQDDLVIYNLGTTVGVGAIRFSDSTSYNYNEWAGLEYHRNGILRLGGPAVFTNNGSPDIVTQLILAASSSADFVITGSNGYVGIGTSAPEYRLDVNGTARVTTLIETSALKYKTNIQPLDSQLSKVAQLEPVTFDWIDKPNPKTNIGLIADEVEKIYPEFVSKTEDGEIEGIEYSKLTTVLIQSIKELKEIVDKQQEQINTLLNK